MNKPILFLKDHYIVALILSAHTIATFIIASDISIHPDMADHWVWSLNFSLGYLEHPPMIAWVMAAFDGVFGLSSPASMKLAAILVWSFTLIFSYWFAVIATNKKTALIYLLLLLGSPYFLGMGLMLHINNLMYFFGALTLLTCAYFFRTKNQNLLILIGVFLGLTALSKLLAVFLCFSIYFWLMLDKNQRFVWKSWQVYAMPIMVLLVMSPFIYWNVQNDWLNIAYQINRGYNLSPKFDLEAFFGFIAGYFLYGIIAVPALILFVLNYKNLAKLIQQNSLFLLLIIQFFVPLVFFTYSATRGGHIDAQWLGIAFFSGLLLLATKFNKVYLALINLALGIIILGVIIAHLYWHILSPWMPAQWKFKDQTMDWVNWQETAEKISQSYKRHNLNPPEIIISQDYTTAAAISIYTPNKPLTYSLRKQNRNIWLKKKELQNKTITFVCDSNNEDCVKNKINVTALIKTPLYPLESITIAHPHSKRKIRELLIFTNQKNQNNPI